MNPVRVAAAVTLDAGAAFEHHSWWYDENRTGKRWGHGSVEAIRTGGGNELRIVSTSPGSLRALAAALVAAADSLDQLYAEHGVEPPAADQ